MLTKDKVRDLRDKLDVHLKTIEADLGFKVHVGNASFTPNSVTFKVELATVAENGTVLDAHAEAFKRNAFLFGLVPEDLGHEFTSNGRRFKLTGLAIKSRKFPFLATDLATGKGFKFTEESVKRGLKRPIDD